MVGKYSYGVCKKPIHFESLTTIQNFDFFNIENIFFYSAMFIIHYFIETGIFIIKVHILPKCLYFVHNAINIFIDDNEFFCPL